jgi:hypothetical protein
VYCDVTSGFIVVEEGRDHLKKDCAPFRSFGRKIMKTEITLRPHKSLDIFLNS